MNDDQLRERLDESIVTILSVSDRYVTDHRGPSSSWVAGLADIVVTLLHARALIPSSSPREET